MNWRRPVRWGLVGVAAVSGFIFLGQLSARADHAADAVDLARAAREDAAIVRTPSSISLMFDRARTQANLPRGWSVPEEGSGTWSAAREAVVRLPTPTAAGDLDVALTLSEVFLAPNLPAQRLVVRAGDTPLGAWRLTSPRDQTLHVTVPERARAGRDQVELQLELPDADAPMRRVFGSIEARVIAIKLKRAEVTATGPACARTQALPAVARR